MTPFIENLTWLQVAIQILTIIVIIVIVNKKKVWSFPYIVALMAMICIFILRIDNIFKFIPLFERNLIQLVASTSFFSYFYRILCDINKS